LTEKGFSSGMGSIEDSKSSSSVPSVVLTFEESLQIANKQSLILKSVRKSIAVQEGFLEQSRTYSNPVLGIEREDFGGSSSEAPKLIVELEQAIPWMGQRAAKIQAAALKLEAIRLDYRIAEMDFNADIYAAFYRLLGAQNRVELGRRRVKVAEQLVQTVSARQEAGKVSPAAVSKAGIAHAEARISLNEAEMRRRNFLRSLTTLMGQAEPEFLKVKGNLGDLETPPSFDVFESQLESSPVLKRWHLSTQAARVKLEMVRKSRRPDLSIRVGTTHFEEDGGDGYSLGLGLEIPIFDRKRGELAARQAILSHKGLLRQQAYMEAHRDLAEKFELAMARFEHAKILKEEILPRAKSAFEMVQEGYRLGKLGYLNLLDSQRTWVQTLGDHIEALVNYHVAFSDLVRLTGGSLKKKGEVKNE
jgi:cobalt-zinc-cadmium efflux system outer membrane protein